MVNVFGQTLKTVVNRISLPHPSWLELPVIGIDISDRSLKYLKLDTPKGWENEQADPRALRRVAYYGVAEIPEGVITGGEVTQVDALAKILRTTLGPRERRAVFIAFSLPEERGFVRAVALPKLLPSEVRSAVELQLDELVPLAPSEAVFDIEIANTDGAGRVTEAVVYAFPRATLLSYTSAIESAGFRPVLAESEMHSLVRVVIPQGETGTVMIVDAGRTRTTFCIAYQRIVRFSSTVQISGGGLTKAIAQAIGGSEEAAEQVKRNFSFENTSDEKLKNVITTGVREMAEQMSQRIAYWETHESKRTEFSVPAVRKIYLTGGESQIAGYAERLSEVLKLPVLRAEPWKQVFDVESYIPPLAANETLAYATALGLVVHAL